VVSTSSKIFLSEEFNPPEFQYGNLVLDGEELKLQSVKLNGKTIPVDFYKVDNSTLTILGSYLKPNFQSNQPGKGSYIELETVVHISPSTNLALSGLYKSGKNLLTQCEAMGFRRIAYHQDRPDILSKYQVYMEANKLLFPVLLSNGNQKSSGMKDGDSRIHWALWEDPFPKPSYLFALVAGDFDAIHDTYTTTSGRKVQLGIFSEKRHVSKLNHAMYSLKRSMMWDEKTFGLECDLDIYNVVATDDFNMGAM
jgi:aminopeptidase N